MKEGDIESLCRLEAARNGMVIWRNARGFDNQRKVTYGLGPDGASDEIGFHSVEITPDMVGKKVAIFTAIEIKKPNAKTNKERLKKQKEFVATIRNRGGISGFATCPEDIPKIIKKCLT